MSFRKFNKFMDSKIVGYVQSILIAIVIGIFILMASFKIQSSSGLDFTFSIKGYLFNYLFAVTTLLLIPVIIFIGWQVRNLLMLNRKNVNARKTTAKKAKKKSGEKR